MQTIRSWLPLLFCFLMVSLAGCGMGHSTMLGEKEINNCCKMYLECAYYMQKTDKSGCAAFEKCCKVDIIFKECSKQYEKNSKEWEACVQSYL